MFQLKLISREAIPNALQKAERYRLLNEPFLAESICHDILDSEPNNHQALIIMLLAITDQFGRHTSVDVNRARQLLPLMNNEYDRHYYSGIIYERQGIAILNMETIEGHFAAYERLTVAMEHFEKAEAIRPPGNDDSILRWNTCARLIMSHNLQPRYEQYGELPLE